MRVRLNELLGASVRYKRVMFLFWLRFRLQIMFLKYLKGYFIYFGLCISAHKVIVLQNIITNYLPIHRLVITPLGHYHFDTELGPRDTPLKSTKEFVLI